MLELTIPLGLYGQAFVDTLLMVGLSSALTFAIGLPLGILLVVTAPGGFWKLPSVNRGVGWVVNGFRATPFIVLMVALIPFTRFLTGTSIGVWAAVVPLTVGGTPFFARLVEVSLRELDPGLIEAAQTLGARKWQVVWGILVPESLPSVIGGFTATVVTLISASAMAGAVGAGGLGDLAIRYGYSRFDTQVMVLVIAILIFLVNAVQLAGDRFVRALHQRRGALAV